MNATDPSEWRRKVLLAFVAAARSLGRRLCEKSSEDEENARGERYVKLESGRRRHRSIVVHGVVGWLCGTGCELMISRCGRPTDGVISSSSSFCVHSACYMAY